MRTVKRLDLDCRYQVEKKVASERRCWATTRRRSVSQAPPGRSNRYHVKARVKGKVKVPHSPLERLPLLMHKGRISAAVINSIGFQIQAKQDQLFLYSMSDKYI